MRVVLSCEFLSDGFYFQFQAEDQRTSLTQRRYVVRDALTMLRIVDKLHGDAETARYGLKRQGRCSVFCELSSAQMEYLGIRRSR